MLVCSGLGYGFEPEHSRGCHYEDFDSVSLIARIERDAVRMTEVRIRSVLFTGWIVPTRYEFRCIFGREWGSEIFTLSSLRQLD